jgi:superfamily II DNA or RNA helicase
MHSVDSGASSDETLSLLTGLARGRFGRISPQRMAEHVVSLVSEPDWPLRRAALEALTRRYAFAQRDELTVSQRPARERLGLYHTRSAGGSKRGARPYDTELSSLVPLRTSCSCPDFVRSSLGLCKHGLTVVEMLEVAGAFDKPQARTPAEPPRAHLRWHAVHPLRGPADRLARLQFYSGKGRSEPAGMQQGKPLARTLRHNEQRVALTRALEKLIARGKLEAEPAVLTVLAEERARAERAVANESNASDALRSLSSLRRKLFPYQREGVKRFFADGRLLLADDMGLGKTTQAIAACHGMFETRAIRRGLLIVPASLKAQWKREWDATTSVPLTVVDGSPAERAKWYANTTPGFLIIGYEQLLRDFDRVRASAPELVVLDEAQRIKNWATKSAAYVKALDARYRLVLTGTPMENRLAELASIVDFVDDVALEPKWRLLPFHTLSQGNAANGVNGAKNLAVLRERLAPAMLRRQRKEVLSQLPARVDTRVPVELTPVQRDAHDDRRQPIARLLGMAAKRPLRQAEFLQLMQLLATQRMICNGMAQLNFEQEWPRCQAAPATPEHLESLFAPKLSTLRGLVEQVVLGQGRKAVVFSQWRNMLRLCEWAVRDLLASAGQRAVFFTGAESAKLRERSVVEFHDDPAVSLMFLSDAGGVGLNLQRAASCCINLELPWNPAVLEQRIGRIYRLGQPLPIDVYNLVSEDGIEARIAELIARKHAVFSNLFDGTTDTVQFEGGMGFLEGVRRLVEPITVPDASSDELEDALPPPAETLVEAAAPPAPASPEPQPATSTGLAVETLADGSLRIHAPAALAAPLADLLDQLARSLRA